MPILQSVRIPPLATVEISDKVWEAALQVKARRQGVTLVKDPVTIGSDDPSKKELVKHFITTPIGDGVYKTFFPIRELVKSGILKVVEAPKLDMTLAEMREAITKEQGFALPKDVAEDVLIAHYHKLFG